MLAERIIASADPAPIPAKTQPYRTNNYAATRFDAIAL
ncbi:hypothetical protein AWB74_06061 [Caballeronia arvi]|uniref:Uncharacterized protein n=1 Tax=Caballeronia arvi TaxID=1777135 RepID=A0A158KN23_9BURK|nr:hypothetical protein AWB74_06061 [Caballeronia arvi]